jgi:hypothetical protein
VAAISGAFIRLLTSFMTSALLDKWPTVRAIAENQTQHVNPQEIVSMKRKNINFFLKQKLFQIVQAINLKVKCKQPRI